MPSVISKCKQCRAVQVTHPGSVSSMCVEHDEERGDETASAGFRTADNLGKGCC